MVARRGVHVWTAGGGALVKTRWFGMVAAAIALLGFALVAPAGATSMGSALPGYAPEGSHLHGSASDPALTLANLAVTNLSTGVTTTDTNQPVTVDTGCGNGTSFFCLVVGGNAGFTMTTGAPIQAGQVYSNPGPEFLAMTVHVGNQGCGEFASGAGGYQGQVEVDQFVFTAVSPQPITSVGIQVFCTDADVSISGTIAYNIENTTPNEGYYLYDNAGNVYGFGNDQYLGYLGNPTFLNLNAEIVAMATTPDGGGFWMTGADGGVFAYGDAGFYGSTGNIHLNKSIVGMASTSDGGGYWFVASDGGVFAYGDAQFFGSMGGSPLNKPIVGMTPTPDDGGYWLVASDGGVFAFGDAGFFGSTGSLHLNKPIVGMSATTDGGGYWLVASDGGIFAFGDAGFFGSTGNLQLAEPITGMVSTDDDQGYLLVASDGGLFAFGDAPFYGSLGGQGFTGVVGVVP